MASMKLSDVPSFNFSNCLPIVGFLFPLTLLLESGWELFIFPIRLWIRGNVQFIDFFYFDPRRRLNYFIQKSTMGSCELSYTDLF